MKAFKTLSIGIILILSYNQTTKAQSSDLSAVKSEIKEAALIEQNAFKKGDCDLVLASMQDSITFLANGRRVPSKAIIGKFCNSIPRPFKKATLDKLEFYVLSPQSGYVIRTLEYPNDASSKMQEYVTKIWKKTKGEWKITHLHTTVKKVALTD